MINPWPEMRVLKWQWATRTLKMSKMIIPLLVTNSFLSHPTKALNILRCNSSQNGTGGLVSADSFCSHGLCCGCGRRRILEAFATAFLPISSSRALSTPLSEPTEMLNSIHPPRPDWYEEFYASVLDKGMKAYEAEVAAYKSQIFAKLKGEAKTVLEIGIGTGPNLKYYASEKDVHVFGIDPNKKMEKYVRTAAVAAGLPPANFEFIQGVAEALPLSDGSVDAVVGTLVLCSVKDVDATLREIRRVLKKDGIYLFVEHVAAEDGTILRLVQGFLDPLQQTVADGCHLTRRTGKNIAEAGFSNIDINMGLLSSASLINPHVYGIAHYISEIDKQHFAIKQSAIVSRCT